MIYRAQLWGGAALHFHQLPPDARDALIMCAADVAEAPWRDTQIAPPGTDASFRQTTFGDQGTLYFYLDDVAQIIWIYNIIWRAEQAANAALNMRDNDPVSERSERTNVNSTSGHAEAERSEAGG